MLSANKLISLSISALITVLVSKEFDAVGIIVSMQINVGRELGACTYMHTLLRPSSFQIQQQAL